MGSLNGIGTITRALLSDTAYYGSKALGSTDGDAMTVGILLGVVGIPTYGLWTQSG